MDKTSIFYGLKNEIKLIVLILFLSLVCGEQSFAQTQAAITGYSGPICQGKTVTLCAPSGYNTFVWSNGGNSSCITVGTAGTYTVTVSNVGRTNTNNQTLTPPLIVSQVVQVNPSPAITIIGSTSICQGKTTTILATPGITSYLWNTGATTNSISIGFAGNYNVVATNTFGCTSSYTHTLTVNPLPVVSISGPAAICQGQTSTLCVPQGLETYSWNNGATTNCITPASSGNYTVTISSPQGCSASATQNFTINTTPQCNITGFTESVCEGQTVNLCVPAGQGNYLWSTGATSTCIAVATQDTYSVTVTNAGGCVATCSKAVTTKPVPTIDITGSSGVICQGETANLCASQNASTYLWNNGVTTRCIDVSSGGNYSVVGTSALGCSGSSSKQITIAQGGSCSITGTNGFICQGQTAQLCAPDGYDNYHWSNGADTKCISTGTAGTYTVTVSNNGTNQCASSCSQSLVVRPIPQVDITGSNGTLCYGTSATLCAPTGSYTYSWSNGAATSCITTSLEGNYSVAITDANGCSATTNLSLVSSPMNFTISGGDNAICAGSSVSLCAPNGFTSYLWNTGASTKCIDVSSAGDYSVSVTNSLGCSRSVTKTVKANTSVCSITGISSPICQGTSGTLCATSGFSSYHWNSGETTECITVSNAGNYSVVVTSGANNCTATASNAVTLKPAAVALISGNNGPICTGQSANLCAPIGYDTYEWNNSASTRCISANSGGSYSVTVTNSSGCSSSTSTNLTVNNPAPCAITGYTGKLCAGQSTTLCAPNGFSNYLWNNGSSTRCITVNSPGNYVVTFYSLTDENTFGCQSTCGQIVEVETAPLVAITSNMNSVCVGGMTQLCVPTGYSSYVWNTGATSSCISTNISGTYTVTLTNSNGCSFTSTKNLPLSPPVQFNISGRNSICQGKTTQICAPPDMTSYSWNTGESSSCITAVVAGNYTVTVTDQNGCISSGSKSLTLAPPPVCSITGPATICSGPVQLCAPQGMVSYSWDGAPSIDEPCLNVSNAGSYTVTITNMNGCTATCTQVIGGTLPPLTVTGNSTACQGGSSILCAPANLSSYLWNTGATTNCITANLAGTYTVTATGQYGCTGTGSKIITIDPCQISMTKKPDVCEIIAGTPTPVKFTYVVTNNSNTFPVSGTIKDDNGTYANTSDDVIVGNWGPLQPGASATLTKTFTISNNYTNIAVATGTMGTTSVTTVASATVSALNCSCNLSYPDNSNLPRSSVEFNESEVLVASDPGPLSCGTTGSVIKLWYMDEHALTLGVRQVNVKTSSGITTTNYPMTPAPSMPTSVVNPLVGTTIASGDQTGNDVAAGGGRPLWPALFITDLTLNGSGSRSGDWQQGGSGVPPSKVCGVWKGAVRLVNKTTNPWTVTVTPDADPPKNHWTMPGGELPPGGTAQFKDEGYGAEVMWNVNDLGLIPGHTYRLQFMVHDGDQNKTGGDCGETCTTIHIPQNICTSTMNIGNMVWSDVNMNGIKDPLEKGIKDVVMKLYNDNNSDNLPDGNAIFVTLTDANGLYKFNALSPGNYIVGAATPAGTMIQTINGDDPDNDIDNDNNAKNVVGLEIRSKSVTIGIGTEPINDGDGSNGNLTIDFGFKPNSAQTLQKCYVGLNHNYVTASQTWTVDPISQTVLIHTVFSKNLVDNTYGTTAVGWSAGHTFSDLLMSDKMQLALFDATNTKKMEFTLDYLSAAVGIPSGYKSMGPTGGEGGMLLGSSTDIISWKTSLEKNFNDYNYILTAKSPSSNSSYSANSTYPNWIFDVWYDVTVKLSAFSNGFGEPVITGVHASPSKTGSVTEAFDNTNCGSTARMSNPSAPESRKINAYVYPNPTHDIANITFERIGSTSHTVVEVFTIEGKKVATLFDGDTEPNVLYKVEFGAANMEKGIYLYKITSGENTLNGKIMLLN